MKMLTVALALKSWQIGLIVAGAILLVAVVLCIIFREKLKKWLRVYKSEVKKIVWLPWPQTRKSTLVVLVVLIVCALVICLLDLGLNKGFLKLIEVISQNGNGAA